MQQQLHLIHEFLEINQVPDDWCPNPTKPTHEEIDTILRPWRPDNVRAKAAAIWTNDQLPLIICTHYNPDDDDKMAEWVEAEEEFRDNAYWACIDDVNHFDFGSDWKMIYDILPEVAGQKNAPRYKIPPDSAAEEALSLAIRRSQFKDYLRELKQSDPAKWRDDPHYMIESAAVDLQCDVCALQIIIMDQEAFETERPLLVSVDYRRNVIRETRFELNDQSMVDIYTSWLDIQTPDWIWAEAKIGDKSRVDREIGRQLYQLTDADFEGPWSLY